MMMLTVYVTEGYHRVCSDGEIINTKMIFFELVIENNVSLVISRKI
jgi:hypothetical protein